MLDTVARRDAALRDPLRDPLLLEDVFIAKTCVFVQFVIRRGWSKGGAQLREMSVTKTYPTGLHEQGRSTKRGEHHKITLCPDTSLKKGILEAGTWMFEVVGCAESWIPYIHMPLSQYCTYYL